MTTACRFLYSCYVCIKSITMAKFSIVIPTYNQLPLFKRALDSVLHQKDVDYEVIVTDDSDNGDIESYINTLSIPAIKYFHHPSNGIVADNWNYGLSKTIGQYVIVMHHDEVMTSNDYLSNIEKNMNNVDVVIADIEVLNQGKKKTRFISHCIHSFYCKNPELLFLQNTIGPTACITFKRENLQFFKSDLKWFIDVEWYYRMLKGKSISLCNNCKIQSLDGHEGQISKNLDIIQAFKQDQNFIRKNYGNNVRLMIWLYEHLILGTKKLIGKI